MKLRIALVPVAFATLFMAACDSSSSSTSNNASPSASNGKKYDCSRAPASAVSAALGVAAGNPVPDLSNGPNGVVVCDYAVNRNPQAVKIRFETGTDKQSFDITRNGFADQQMTTSDVAGVGDEAYSSTIPATQYSQAVNTLAALKSDVSVQVVSSASIDQEKAFAQQLLS